MADDAAQETSVTQEEVETAQETESPAEAVAEETEGAEATPEATDQEGSDEESSEANADDESDDTAPQDNVDPKEAARRGYAERTRIRTEVTQALNEIAQLPTAEQFIEQGIDPALAEVEVLKADIQRKEAINHVTELNSGLNQDALQVTRDFPIFNEKSPEYDEQFTHQIEDLYKQAAGFQMDPSGRFVTQANMPLYDFYAAVMNIRGSGASQGVAKGQKAAERMMAAAETPSSSQGKDPEMDAFEKGLKGL